MRRSACTGGLLASLTLVGATRILVGLTIAAASLMTTAVRAQELGCGEDPAGDTFGPQPRHDIISLCAEHTATDLVLRVTTRDPFDPAGGGGPRAIVFMFRIDADQDPATGGADSLRNGCADDGLIGTDLVVLIVPGFGSRGPDFDIKSVRQQGIPPDWPVVDTGTPTYGANSLTVAVPLTLLEGFGFDTAVNARVGVGPEAGSDCAPNGTWVVSVPAASPVPLLEEPGLILLGISLLVVGGLVLLGKKRLFRPA